MRRWLVERHIDRAFETRPDGNVAFYPFGALSEGYLARTREEEQRLRAAMEQYVRSYLRLGLALSLGCLVTGGALHVAVKFGLMASVPTIPIVVLIGVVPFAGFTYVLAIVSRWHRSFRTVGKTTEVLPSVPAQWSVVRQAASRMNRSQIKARLILAALVGSLSLGVLIWLLPSATTPVTVLLVLIVVGCLVCYLWYRLILESTSLTRGGREPNSAVPADAARRRG